jgi:hypothetical protein
MSASTPTEKSTEDQVADLRAVKEKLAAVVATIQGNQGQLTVAINRLQSDKLLQTNNASAEPSASHRTQAGTSVAASHVAKLGHKLLFPTYDGQDDPLPWLNRCEQFFRIQARRRLVRCSSPHSI